MTDAAASPDTPAEEYRFVDMNIKPGDRVQLQLVSQPGQPRHIVRVIGYLDNIGVLVTAPFRQGTRVDILEDETLVVRVFSGQNAFAFRSGVMRVCRLPFDYLHLSFPQRIQGSMVRKAARVRVETSARRVADETTRGDEITIENISASGALLRSPSIVGDNDEIIRLDFAVTLHEVETSLQLKARIRNTQRDETRRDKGVEYNHGVEFIELTPNERMILRSLVYQQMIERPESVV